MPRRQLYEAGLKALEDAYRRGLSDELPKLTEPRVEGAIADAISSPDKVHRYGVVGQTLLKIVEPDVSAWQMGKKRSARAFVRNTIAEFEGPHLDSLLGGSSDPYASHPFRPPRERFDHSQAEGAMADRWHALFAVLDFLDVHPEEAPAVLARSLAAALARRQPLDVLIRTVLKAQPSWKEDPVAKALRKETVEDAAPTLIAKHLPDTLYSEGSAETGTQAEVPWFRVYSPLLSPSAQLGYYVAYLFAADGSAAFLSLMCGTEKESALAERVDWARTTIGREEELLEEIDLRSTQQKANSRPRLYERGSVCAMRYDVDSIPPEGSLLSDLQRMIALLERVYAAVRAAEGSRDVNALTVELVEELSAGLILPEGLIATAVAELRAGRHLLLVGIPGTAKTAFAQALTAAAAQAGLSSAPVLTTATSDWTTVDTVGGYRLERGGQGSELRFRPGLVLDAIDRDSWLVIDELNRADIDKSLGQLFTVLSGFPVVLPFTLDRDGISAPPAIVPADAEMPEDTYPYVVTPTWRIIATLNTRDRDLLFSMSYALMRRFAVLEIGVPSRDDFDAILEARGSTGSAELDSRVRQLARLPGRPIGPAIVIHCLEFARHRLALEPGVEPAEVLRSALVAHVLPQLDDLTRPQQRALVAHAWAHLLRPWPVEAVTALFGRLLQVPASELTPAASEIAAAKDSESILDTDDAERSEEELEGLIGDDVQPG